MFVSNLKRILVILLISVSALSVNAQENHFVYLQTENTQPFYVRVNNKLISSSPAGYVILPDLSEGDYQLIVGFPKNEFPEEDFKISVEDKNQGFLLKNFGEKGWGLFNMQSLALLPGTHSNLETTSLEPASSKVDSDPFSQMLANVVKDSSILEKHGPVMTVKGVVAKNDSVVETPENKSVETTPGVVETAAAIKKVLTTSDSEGMQMIYVDETADKKDTVRVLIPAEKDQLAKTGEKAAVAENKNPGSAIDTSELTITPTVITPESDTVTLVNDTIRVYKESTTKNSSEISEPSVIKQDKAESKANPEATESKKKHLAKRDKQRENEIIILPKAATSSTTNSDCKDFATDGDFLKLRKKMAAENNIDGMIRMAKKVFRNTCFSTEQIRNLSYLFLSDEEKYRFFDVAYPHTSDSEQYQSLESQLTDPYYIKRFNAMIHK